MQMIKVLEPIALTIAKALSAVLCGVSGDNPDTEPT
jgi:hypothetical protein